MGIGRDDHGHEHVHVHIHLDSVDDCVVKALLSPLQRMEKRIMATLAEVKAALALAAETAADEKAEVAVKFADLAAQVQALKDQIAAGSGVTAADLDEILTALTGISASVEDITVPEVPVP